MPDTIKRLLCSRSLSVSTANTTTLLVNRVITPPQTGDDRSAEERGRQLVREFYSKHLARQFEHFVILAGAGTSTGIGKGGNTGKTMSELWEITAAGCGFDFRDFCATVKHPHTDKDLEKLLSTATRLSEYLAGISTNIDAIETIIAARCKLDLPDNSPHELLLSRITSRKLKFPRSRLFTLNYDCLFEMAAQRGAYTAIDGFSFSNPRIFNGMNFDYDLVIREKSRIKNEENFVPRVFHLYKLHGSIDWGLSDGAIVQAASPARPLMIFPRYSKYERSYDAPFFDMMSRFQQSLRTENTLLICLGFSLNDKHIFSAIRDAIQQNPGIQVLVVNRTIRADDNWTWLTDRALTDAKVTVIAEEFTDFVNNMPSTDEAPMTSPLPGDFGGR